MHYITVTWFYNCVPLEVSVFFLINFIIVKKGKKKKKLYSGNVFDNDYGPCMATKY